MLLRMPKQWAVGFHVRDVATLLLLLVMFSALCDSMVALPLQKYPSVGSPGPYRDPGIGGTTCTLYHGVSTAHGLHSAVDASWKFEIAILGTLLCSYIKHLIPIPIPIHVCEKLTFSVPHPYPYNIIATTWWLTHTRALEPSNPNPNPTQTLTLTLPKP